MMTFTIFNMIVVCILMAFSLTPRISLIEGIKTSWSKLSLDLKKLG